MWKSLWSLCVRFVKTLWKDFCPPFVQVLSSLSLFVILVRGSIDGWDRCVIIYKVNLDASVSTISSLIQPLVTFRTALSSLWLFLCPVCDCFVTANHNIFWRVTKLPLTTRFRFIWKNENIFQQSSEFVFDFKISWKRW